ncbi:hypothetical protein PFLUV_G00000300 [Perca fluviatilis]|uniref:Uncharacterized protein n=1 Tax=Perca fluviatilis TaxID=8168 RepID=A0A6A5FL91_PERFL|nr:hypothetical protein PFLUV_G00000300 [Perca fluviatilis]
MAAGGDASHSPDVVTTQVNGLRLTRCYGDASVHGRRTRSEAASRWFISSLISNSCRHGSRSGGGSAHHSHHPPADTQSQEPGGHTHTYLHAVRYSRCADLIHSGRVQAGAGAAGGVSGQQQEVQPPRPRLQPQGPRP